MTFFSILAIPTPFSTIFPSMTKRPFQKKHLIQVFVGGGVGLLIITFVFPPLDIYLWPGLMFIGSGGIIAIAEPRRQTVADWIVR